MSELDKALEHIKELEDQIQHMRPVYDAAIAWRKSSMKVSAPEHLELFDAVNDAIPAEVKAMRIRMMELACRPWMDHKKRCSPIKNEDRCACGCMNGGRYCMEE